jgi:ribose-phosphate pyrophosphokinase
MTDSEILVFAGSASRRLTARICTHLGMTPANGEVRRFSEGNLFVQVNQNVRGQPVYVIQSVAFQPNDSFMELLFWIDALRRASAESVTVVMPYFSYGKGDKKDEPRVSIRARVCADALEAAGAARIVTLDLHAPQIQGFFRVPVDDLYALPVLTQEIGSLGLRDPVVVSPDAGFVKQARRYADRLGATVAIAYKERKSHDERSAVLDLVGLVEGRPAVIVDDFTISGGTIANAADMLLAHGATEVYAAVSHGVFAERAMERIEASPIRQLIVTDSVENQPVLLSDRIQVVSVAPLFAEAIRRIHRRQSVSVLFDG